MPDLKSFAMSAIDQPSRCIHFYRQLVIRVDMILNEIEGTSLLLMKVKRNPNPKKVHSESGFETGKNEPVYRFSPAENLNKLQGFSAAEIIRGIQFGVCQQSLPVMLTDIEEIVFKELSGLCESCIHFEACVYRKNSKKVVIQCEVFESSQDLMEKNEIVHPTLRDLCLNCSKNRFCQLPREASGVWHCEEYD